jgi:SAM-dependent methyltransferase
MMRLSEQVATGLQQTVARHLQTSNVARYPGHPVNVFMPHHLSQLQDERLFVTPKTDGTKWLLFFHQCRAAFADGAYRWFRKKAAERISQPVHKLLRKPLLVEGEWYCEKDSKPIFYIFDVFIFRGACVRHRSFGERFKFAPLIAEALQETLPDVQTYIKPFYSAQSQLGFVLDSLKKRVDGSLVFQNAFSAAFQCDGVVFQHSHVGLRPYKFKEARDVTVDFLTDGTSLMLTRESRFDSDVYIDRLGEPLPSGSQHFIVECRFDPSLPAADPSPDFPLVGQWVYVRDRPHKCRSNSRYVFDRNVLLLVTGFSFQTLRQETERHRGGYYSAQNPAKKRRDFKSVSMKDYHNRCVKQDLYSRYLPHCKSLCELGIGRGADVSRIVRNCTGEFERLLGIDVDSDGLAECRKRWLAQRQNNTERLDIELERVDLSDGEACAALGSMLRNQFDLVVSNFSLHYFHETMPTFLNSILRPGGVFVATLFDMDRVKTLVPEVGNVFTFSVDGEDVARIRRASDQSVGVWMDSIGKEHVEKLVDITAFCQSMGGAGFEIVTDRNFGSWADVARQRDIDYGPDHLLWQFTELNCALVFRARGRVKSSTPVRAQSPTLPSSPANTRSPTLPSSPVNTRSPTLPSSPVNFHSHF